MGIGYPQTTQKNTAFPYRLLIIFLLLAAVLVLGGYWNYKYQREQFLSKEGNNLEVISELKIQQIANWRSERLGDASVIFDNSLIINEIENFTAGRAGSGIETGILRWMRSIKEHYRYKEIFLIGVKGNVCLTTGGKCKELNIYEKRTAEEAVNKGRIVMSDLYESGNEISLSLAAPLLAGGDSKAVGCIVLNIDPNDFLYQLLSLKEIPGETSEALLVRRDGDEVLYLNNIRHKKDTALKFRLPLSNKNFIAAMVIKGREGILEGTDYRDVQALAAGRPIPETAWFLVIKQDMEELIAPLRILELYNAVAVAVLILLSGSIFGLLWSRKQVQHHMREREKAGEEILRLNEYLRLRAEQLEAANKELGAFSYNVSHDLRAPLRAIDGFSKIIVDEYSAKLNDEGRRMLKIVMDNAGKMGQLIDDILAFSRMGRKEAVFVDIDMNIVLQEAINELKSTVVDRNVSFKIKPLPPAKGDRAMIKQALVNLISNAVKFTGQREAAVIDVGSTTPAPPYQGGESEKVVYYVKDNGVGFDMQYYNKLFGVFQRLHGSGEFEGTGIGLAIVKRIIEKHGGQVWAEGKVGEGAAFYFTLPKA